MYLFTIINFDVKIVISIKTNYRPETLYEL